MPTLGGGSDKHRIEGPSGRFYWEEIRFVEDTRNLQLGCPNTFKLKAPCLMEKFAASMKTAGNLSGPDFDPGFSFDRNQV
jgi:hypothetical protein